MKFYVFFVLLIFILNGCNNENLKIKKIHGTQIKIDHTQGSDSSITQFISPYKTILNDRINAVLAYTPKTLSRTESALESSLGNIYADICYIKADSIFNAGTGNNIDFALFNYYGIRNIIPKGNITVGNIFELMPFENKLVVVELDGSQILELINYIEFTKLAHPISHLKLEMNNEKITSILISNQPFDNRKNYYVLTHDYLQHGGDNMVFFKEPITLFNTQYKVRDAIIDYLMSVDTLDAKIDGRFVNLN